MIRQKYTVTTLENNLKVAYVAVVKTHHICYHFDV